MNLGYLLIATVSLVTAPNDVPVSEALKTLPAIQLPRAVAGPFDHFGIDLTDNRLFATAENYHAVLVLDINTGKIVHEIKGVAKPHAVLFRDDLDRLYVTDGVDGSLKIFDGKTYAIRKSIKLEKDADSIGFDSLTNRLYVVSGGRDAGETASSLTVIDTTTEEKIADLKIDGDTLEAMVLDTFRPRLYLNNPAKGEVDVINRYQNMVIAKWPVTLGKRNVAMALDEPHQRLFTACRSGQIVVFDTNTGKELEALPIAQGVDDVTYDAASKRLYAVGGGSVEVFAQADADHYQSLGKFDAGSSLAKTGKLVPQLNRIFVAAPQSGTASASIAVFEPANIPVKKSGQSETPETVSAPYAENLVLSMLTEHPDLRKMGIHAVPPGGTDSLIIANGNSSRVGFKSSKGDLEAVRDGKSYCAKKDDGAYFNLKLPLNDAAGRHVGILVMEMPYTSATDDADAIRKAEAIRSEVSQKIPDLGTLFAK